MVIRFLDKESSKDDQSFRIDEWGPEATEAMCKEVRTFKVPGGKDDKVLTIGDYIDRTPKDLISKVMLEEKVYETWYSGRAVLLGDGKLWEARCLFFFFLQMWFRVKLPLTYCSLPPLAFSISSLPQGKQT